MDNPETYGEEEVTCPYCQHETSDSFELGDSGTKTCSECGKKYEWQRDVSISYSSEGIE